jgi:dienelactone hydrolase
VLIHAAGLFTLISAMVVGAASVEAGERPPVLTAAEARARAFVHELARASWEHPATPFDATMTRVMPAAAVRAFWEKVEGVGGAFREIASSRVEVKGVYRVVHVACACARGRVDVRVVFDVDDRVTGLFYAPEADAPPSWTPPSYVRTDTFEEREVTVGTAPALPGTLTLPKGKGPFPAAVLVHGSGPNDRDETLGGTKIFKDLAWGLASRGIVVLRYDKRSKVSPAGVVTQKEEVVDGARAAIALMRHTPEVDARRVFVIGHSQGGTLAPRIAAGDATLAGVVILAGSTRPLGTIFVDQFTYLSTLDPDSPALAAGLEAARAFKRAVEDPHLRADQDVAVPMGGHLTGAYVLDDRVYDPGAAARRLTCPILVLRGQRDYQVTTTDFEGWQRALAGRAHVTFKLYPGLNHLFVNGFGAPTPAEYARPGHVFPAVVDDVAAWIAAGGVSPS